jgi:hypothetical protein
MSLIFNEEIERHIIYLCFIVFSAEKADQDVTFRQMNVASSTNSGTPNTTIQ